MHPGPSARQTPRGAARSGLCPEVHGSAAPRRPALLPVTKPRHEAHGNSTQQSDGTRHSAGSLPAKISQRTFLTFSPCFTAPAPPQIRVGVDQCCYRGKRWKSGSRRKQLLFSLYCMLTEYVIAAIWGAGQPTRPHACGTSSVCTDVSPAMTGFTRPDAEGHRSPSFPPPHLHCACCPDRSLKCSLGAGRCR